MADTYVCRCSNRPTYGNSYETAGGGPSLIFSGPETSGHAPCPSPLYRSGFIQAGRSLRRTASQHRVIGLHVTGRHKNWPNNAHVLWPTHKLQKASLRRYAIISTIRVSVVRHVNPRFCACPLRALNPGRTCQHTNNLATYFTRAFTNSLCASTLRWLRCDAYCWSTFVRNIP